MPLKPDVRRVSVVALEIDQLLNSIRHACSSLAARLAICSRISPEFGDHAIEAGKQGLHHCGLLGLKVEHARQKLADRIHP